MPDQVDKVGGIVAIVDGEGGIEADLIRIVAQQPRADAVEGAGPLQRVGHDSGLVAQHLSGDAFDALAHFGGSPSRKCHQQNAPGIGAVDDEMGDPVRQRVGFPGPGTGNYQKRRSRPAVTSGHNAVLDGPALFRIEAFEVARRRWHVRIVLLMIRPSLIPALFAMARSGRRPHGRFSAIGSRRIVHRRLES